MGSFEFAELLGIAEPAGGGRIWDVPVMMRRESVPAC
jgi:hypothetical protein